MVIPQSAYHLLQKLHHEYAPTEPLVPDSKDCSNSIEMRRTGSLVVGLIIRIVPPIRKAMIGDNALLRLIDNSASLLGEAAIPSIILLLGANLRRGLKGSGVSPLLVVRILAVRYILLKWAHACVIQISRKHAIFRTFQQVLFLQYTISQLLEIGVSESSYILLWTYVVASISVTLWTAFYMWLLT
ncbi:hypothetical protein CICLE_v10023689mg [Citrus x clementina]|uniref:Uncharacterized protein n=1 Tax=Citrus clementina TaxID=85681 RepID=V4T7K0_CITCL|nr:hypothetical protein CICLE_v10023689mg [Citrus x clementina]